MKVLDVAHSLGSIRTNGQVTLLPFAFRVISEAMTSFVRLLSSFRWRRAKEGSRTDEKHNVMTVGSSLVCEDILVRGLGQGVM